MYVTRPRVNPDPDRSNSSPDYEIWPKSPSAFANFLYLSNFLTRAFRGGEENPRVPYLVVFLFRRITGCVQRGYLRGSSRAKVEDPIKRRGTCFEIKILYGIGPIYDEPISKVIYYREEKRARSMLIFHVYRLTNRRCFRGVIERGIMGAVNVSAFGNCKCPQELFLIDVDSMWRRLFNNQVALQQTIMIDDRTPHYFNAIINRDDEFSLKLFSIWHQCYTGTISDENETLNVKSSIDSLFPATISNSF